MVHAFHYSRALPFQTHGIIHWSRPDGRGGQVKGTGRDCLLCAARRHIEEMSWHRAHIDEQQNRQCIHASLVVPINGCRDRAAGMRLRHAGTNLVCACRARSTVPSEKCERDASRRGQHDATVYAQDHRGRVQRSEKSRVVAEVQRPAGGVRFEHPKVNEVRTYAHVSSAEQALQPDNLRRPVAAFGCRLS